MRASIDNVKNLELIIKAYRSVDAVKVINYLYTSQDSTRESKLPSLTGVARQRVKDILKHLRAARLIASTSDGNDNLIHPDRARIEILNITMNYIAKSIDPHCKERDNLIYG